MLFFSWLAEVLLVVKFQHTTLELGPILRKLNIIFPHAYIKRGGRERKGEEEGEGDFGFNKIILVGLRRWVRKRR